MKSDKSIVVEHTTRLDGMPITRTTYTDDKGNQMQVVEYEDNSTPIVSVLPAGSEYSIIKQTNIERK